MLLKLGLVVDVYYASEIDPDALMVSASHFGDRIVHLGDVMDITREKIKEMTPIDLLIGGSPCNDLSLANPARLGLYGNLNRVIATRDAFLTLRGTVGYRARNVLQSDRGSGAERER